MSDQALLLVGTMIFAVTVWATIAFGYWRFGAWYDRNPADAERDAATPVRLDGQHLVVVAAGDAPADDTAADVDRVPVDRLTA